MRIVTGSDGRKYETNEPVIITDNTKTIANMESKIAEYSVYVNAILDQFAVAHHSYDNKLSPYDNLSNLIAYHVGIALDPRVSKQADEWVTRIAELEADIAIKQEWMFEKALRIKSHADAMEKSNDRLTNALEIAIEALERIVIITPYDVKPCRVATEALAKIKGE